MSGLMSVQDNVPSLKERDLFRIVSQHIDTCLPASLFSGRFTLDCCLILCPYNGLKKKKIIFKLREFHFLALGLKRSP